MDCPYGLGSGSLAGHGEQRLCLGCRLRFRTTRLVKKLFARPRSLNRLAVPANHLTGSKGLVVTLWRE